MQDSYDGAPSPLAPFSPRRCGPVGNTRGSLTPAPHPHPHLDVNLLSSLSPISSTPLVLPFSRLASFSPAPPPSSGGAPARPHSLSISQHTRTLSSGTLASPHDPSATPPHPHPSHPHPSLRRSIRRTLPLVRAAHVDLRASPCPVGALGRAGGARGAGDEGEEEGWVLCLAVRGGAGVREVGEEREGERAFEVERVEVLLEGAAAPPTSSATATATASATAPHDLELRPVAPPGPTPTARGGALVRLRAGSPAQHNLLYALCRAPDGLAGRGAATTPAPAPSVPRTVLQSPSMALRGGGGRFGGGAGGFGGAGVEDGEREGGEGGGAGEEERVVGRGRSGERKVEVVLWGREVLLRSRGRRRGRQEGGAVQGYDVPGAEGSGAPDDARPNPAEGKNDDADDADDDTDTGTDVVEPLTDLFASRFHTTLDLSTLLSPRTTTTPHTRHAAFAPPGPSTPSRARPSSLGPPSFLPSAPPLRPAPPAASSSLALSLSVAGSKRHTRAALAAASAPGLGRSTATMGGFAPQQQQRRESRALPETPQSPVVVPPPPRPASGGTGFQRASLPVPDAAPGAGAGARPKEGRRTSWMSGLVPGAGAGAGAGGATGGGGAGADRTSWPAGAAPPDSAPAPVATLGLGLDDPALAPRATSAAPGRPAGRLTISVSLVPLRAAKSRHRVPFAGAVAAGTATATATAMGGAADTGRTNAALPPPVLPGLAISRAPSPAPAAAAESQGTPRFAFPPSPSPSPSTTPLPSPPLPRAPARAAADRAAAQRTALATSRMPRVNLLDVFLVEVFVLNHSDQVRRLTVGVPARAVGSGAGAGRMTGTSVGQADDGEADAARLVPLENDVRIGCAPTFPPSLISLSRGNSPAPLTARRTDTQARSSVAQSPRAQLVRLGRDPLPRHPPGPTRRRRLARRRRRGRERDEAREAPVGRGGVAGLPLVRGPAVQDGNAESRVPSRKRARRAEQSTA